MEKRDIKRLISIIANGLIIVLVIIYLILSLSFEVSGSMMGAGWGILKYYTTLSNIFAMITSAILLPYQIISFVKKHDVVPVWSLILKLTSTVSVMLTFLISALYLGPINVTNGRSYWEMFSGTTMIVHLIVPLLAFASFCFLESSKEIKFRYSFLGLWTVLTYSIFYIINYYCHLVEGDGLSLESRYDWYSFFQSESILYVIITIIVIFSFTYAISFLLWFLNKKTAKHKA